ncbi:pLS20_p028 family conjugation system transmembrane protein [Streptococcus dentiloxodontae]
MSLQHRLQGIRGVFMGLGLKMQLFFMEIYYKNFTELLNSDTDIAKVKDESEGGFPPASGFDWFGLRDVNEQANANTINFFTQWGNYLHTTNNIMADMIYPIPGYIARILYQFSTTLTDIFYRLFHLFGIFSNIGDTTTIYGKWYQGLQNVGIAIFILLLVIRVLMAWFGSRVNWMDILNNLLLVTLVTAFLPRALSWAGNEVANIAYDSSSIQNDGANTSEGDGTREISLAPFHNNVVDLVYLIEYNFDTDKLGLVDDQYTLSPVKAEVAKEANWSGYNELTSTEAITKWDSGDNFTTATDTGKENIKDLANQILNSSQYHDVYIPLTHTYDGNRVVTLKDTSSFLDVLRQVYLRYTVNWLGLYAMQITIILILIFMIVAFVQDVYKILMLSIIAPIIGYTSVENSSKFKMLIRQIIAGFAGAIFQVMILNVSVTFMVSLPKLMVSGLPTASLLGDMGQWAQTVLYIILYIGIFQATVRSMKLVEQWLGMPADGQGASPSGGGSPGSFGAAMAPLAAVGGAAMMAGRTGTAVGMNAAGGARNIASSTASGVKKGAQVGAKAPGGVIGKTLGVALGGAVGGALGGARGAASHAGNTAKETAKGFVKGQGLSGFAEGGIRSNSAVKARKATAQSSNSNNASIQNSQGNGAANALNKGADQKSSNSPDGQLTNQQNTSDKYGPSLGEQHGSKGNDNKE